MAHFAELNENNVVKRIIVISNSDITDVNGIEKEELGVEFCKSLFGEHTKWIQTSYNGNTRGKYAQEGDTYNAELDKFIPIPPTVDPNWVPPQNIIDVEEVTPTPALEG